MKLVNADDIYEKELEKAGLDIGKPEDIFSDEGQELRGKAKRLTKGRQTSWVAGRLGIVIDGTGKDLNKIGRQKKLLDQLGYETMMIFANTSLEIAQQRNKERRRTLPEKAVAEMWSQVQKTHIPRLLKADARKCLNAVAASLAAPCCLPLPQEWVPSAV